MKAKKLEPGCFWVCVCDCAVCVNTRICVGVVQGVVGCGVGWGSGCEVVACVDQLHDGGSGPLVT